MSKLILGTASFGQPYGIKGDPVPDEKELEKIARTAWDANIRVIHTSWQYNLPKICDAIFSEFEKIEKCNPDAQYFKWGIGLGLSIYRPDELLIEDGLEMFMIPINILDNRFLNCKLKQYVGFDHRPIFKVIARSVFLQGLLLTDELPEWLSTEAKTMIKVFHHACRANRLYAHEAALGYVLGLDDIDRVIVGVNSSKQLEQLLTVKPLKWEYNFSISDENVLDPRRWPKA